MTQVALANAVLSDADGVPHVAIPAWRDRPEQEFLNRLRGCRVRVAAGSVWLVETTAYS